MALQSQLFKGDPKLEAAAVADNAHIVPGAKGPHVGKIQQALNLLDGAGLAVDGIYGPATAAAVLAFKKKRNIINTRYQSSADNIVGKMTMAALDGEMLRLEPELGKRPRIVSVRPAPKRPPEPPPRSLFQTVGFQSQRGAKTLVEGNPRIIIPNGLLQTMELLPNRVGNFQVVDGIGGTVGCWDESVGKVFHPNQPTAHGGTLRISQKRQDFEVRSQGVGRTFIEAKKAGNSAFPMGDLISLAVVAQSTKLMWNPQWNPTVTNPLSCVPFASNAFGPPAVLGMGIFGPKFAVNPTVNPDQSIAVNDFEIGILQAVIASSMEAIYVDAAGTPTWTLTISESTLPIRDSEDDTPVWAKKAAFKALNAPDGKSLKFEDRPRNVVPWQTKNKKGTLVSSSGADLYSTWLAARQKSTGAFTFICFAVWSIDWSCQFDFKTEKGTPTGVGSIRSQGDDGQGPFAPITGGKIANKEVTLTWTGPPDGFR